MPEQVNPVPQSNPVSVAPQAKKPINWKLIGIIAVVAAILIGGAGYAAVVLNVLGTKEEPAPTTKTATPSTTTKKEEPKDETEGWLVFENNKYNFSFKYPNRLRKCCGIQTTVKDIGTDSIVTLGDVPKTELGSDKPFDGIEITVDPSFEENYFSKYVEARKKEWSQNYKEFTQKLPPNPTQTEISVDGQVGVVLIGYTWFGADIIYAPFPDKKKVLIIGKNQKSTNTFKEFNLIISTFKFLD